MLYRPIKLLSLIIKFFSVILSSYIGVWNLQVVSIMDAYNKYKYNTLNIHILLKTLLVVFIIGPFVSMIIYILLSSLSDVLYKFSTYLETRKRISKDFGIKDKDILNTMVNRFINDK